MNQHLRALKLMGCEPSGQFITSLIEMKLDPDTMFEWQKHTPAVPHYNVLLEFVNLQRNRLNVRWMMLRSNLGLVDLHL